jgi:oligopeptidase B
MRSFQFLPVALHLFAATVSALAPEPTRANAAEALPPVLLSPSAPRAPRAPRTEVLHGDPRTDDYAWLRRREDPAVRAYHEAENAYAATVLEGTRALQETIHEELTARLPDVERSLPEQGGEWEYSWRTACDAEHPVFVRRRGAAGAEQVLLDLEELGRGQAYAALTREELSPDGRFWAFVVDSCGGEEGTLRVKDLATGATLPDAIEGVVHFTWGWGRPTLLYSRRAGGRHRLFQHDLGAPVDQLLHEDGEHFWFCHSRETVTVSRLVRSGLDWTIRRLEALEREARRGLWRAGPSAPARSLHFDIDGFRDHTVRYTRDGGRMALVVDGRDGPRRTIRFPGPVYELTPAPRRPGLGEAPARYRFVLDSFSIPSICYEYDAARDDLTVVQETRIPGFDGSLYESRWLEVPASDGARIPVSLVYRRGEPLSRRPLLLQAYGAYGLAYGPHFSAERLSLLDRGVVVAIAHVRGGGERGEDWSRAGRGPGKRTAVADVLAVGQALVDAGITTRERMALHGVSAGGFLAAAAANARPDLFAVILVDVGVTDLLSVLQDPASSTRASAQQEWGDPAVAADYRWLRELCPTANLGPRAYPSMLVRTSWHDSRVPSWAAARYVAKLRAVKTDANPVLLVTRWSGGHLGPSRRSERLREEAAQQAFLLSRLGVTR